jgi:RimJ/RimL family protein N-acetyltransferase
MLLALADGFTITDIAASDKTAYLEHFAAREFHEHITVLPFPYTAADADQWLAHVAAETAREGRSVNWAIRDPGGRLAGGIGFTGYRTGTSHRAELGYWLAKPLWGRGIMTDAARRVSRFAFDDLALMRLYAYVLDFNLASARVLEKAGFEREGRLRGHILRDGRLSDAFVYGRLKG